jgi:hypothetical protein
VNLRQYSPGIAPENSPSINEKGQYQLDHTSLNAMTLLMQRNNAPLSEVVQLERGETLSDPRPNKAPDQQLTSVIAKDTSARR